MRYVDERDLIRAPGEVLEDIARSRGIGGSRPLDVISVRGADRLFLIVSARAANAVLVRDGEVFRKGGRCFSFRYVCGDGTATAAATTPHLSAMSARSRASRRSIQRALSRGRAESSDLRSLICKEVDRCTSRWATGKVDVWREAYHILARISMSYFFDREPDQAFDQIMDVVRRSTSPVAHQMRSRTDLEHIVDRLPGSGGDLSELARLDSSTDNGEIAALTARRNAMRALVDWMVERPSAGRFGDDVLSLRMLQMPQAGSSLRHVVSHAIGLVFASFENTASAIAWTLYHLARRPELQSAVRDDAGERLRSLFHEGASNVGRVVDETLRLRPPVWAFLREALTDADLFGTCVTKGDAVIVSPWLLHRLPSEWDLPEEFRPERFRAGQPRTAFVPFGAGGLACVGQSVARAQMRFLLTYLLRSFSFMAERSESPEPLFGNTQVPWPGVWLGVAAR